MQSLSVCRLSCHKEEFGTIWPKPTGDIQISNKIVQIDLSVDPVFVKISDDVNDPMQKAFQRFIDMQKKNIPKYKMKSGGKKLIVDTTIEVSDMSMELIKASFTLM